MAGNRKAAQALILDYIGQIVPGSENIQMYERWLGGLSDKDFDKLMQDIEAGKVTLPYIQPNLSDKKISVERNLKIAKRLGHDFFQRLWLTDPVSGETYLTPKRYMVVDLILRRQVQLLKKGQSTAEDTKHVDIMTGQATGISQASKVSFPELQILYAQGFESSITELIKFRGGDAKAFQMMNAAMIKQGGFRQGTADHLGTRAKATDTLAVILKAMHLDNTL